MYGVEVGVGIGILFVIGWVDLVYFVVVWIVLWNVVFGVVVVV